MRVPNRSGRWSARAITVIINDFAIAAALATNPSIRILCCPGRYHSAEGYVFGTQTIASINAQRLATYRSIAQKTGTPIDAVQKQAGDHLIAATPAGQFVMENKDLEA